MELRVVFLLCCLGAGLYPLIFSRWARNSKYSQVGGMRALAQSISYEISLAFIFMGLILALGGPQFSLLLELDRQLWAPLAGTALLMLVLILAETYRTPFDLAEGESELVSGFNTEYMRAGFVLFFLAEYRRIIFLSYLFSLIFLGAGGLAIKGLLLIG